MFNSNNNNNNKIRDHHTQLGIVLSFMTEQWKCSLRKIMGQ